jgi:hypothetical protein
MVCIMPLQNRVDPFGKIIATPQHGTLMGNRGQLHNDHKQLLRQKCSEKRWIYCQLEFNGRKREVMAPGQYTELFFLDQPTAVAAGHRPCASCRRQEYLLFREAVAKGNPGLGIEPNSPIDAVDRAMHHDRLTELGEQKVFEARLVELPDGTIVVAGPKDGPQLWAGQRLLPWSFDGYGPGKKVAAEKEVTVLTPRLIVNALSSGFPVVLAPMKK